MIERTGRSFFERRTDGRLAKFAAAGYADLVSKALALVVAVPNGPCMTIAFQCEYCGRRYSSGDELSGKTIMCRQCERPIRIPKPGPTPEREEAPRSEPVAAVAVEFEVDCDVAPQYVPQVRSLPEPTRREARETWAGSTSFGLGCVSLLVWLIPILGLPITILGLVLGGMGLNGPAKNKAAVGVVLSGVGLLLTFLATCASCYLLGYQSFSPVAR